MGYESIIVERDGGVGTITLNRPEVLNAMNLELVREMDTAIGEFESDSEIGAIIFTGTGDRAFSAGADVNDMADVAKDDGPAQPEAERKWQPWHIAACIKPTIGAINGLAYGGGAVLASSFDIRVGCERTSFKFLAASLGKVNSTWTLPTQVGWSIAKELLFTARVVEAKEAYHIGLLNHLVSSDELMAKAVEIARQIAANDAGMVQGAKELMLRGVGESLGQRYQNELDAQEGKLKPAPVEDGFKDFLERKSRS